MSNYLQRATITIDQLAEQFFLPTGQPTRRIADIMAELQDHLQDKGDDPRYCRVVFAKEGQGRFVEIAQNHVELAGVFPRYLFVPYDYGEDNLSIRNIMGVNIRDTLVVVNSEPMGQLWETELRSLKYDIRRLPSWSEALSKKAQGELGGSEVSEIERTPGLYAVERKFGVMHYEPKWPPREQRETGTPPDKRCRFMSDLLNRKLLRGLRDDISSRSFETMASIKEYVLNYVAPKITKEDFGDMSAASPTVSFRAGRCNKFYEYTFQWHNPLDRSVRDAFYGINDPWFSIRITRRG